MGLMKVKRINICSASSSDDDSDNEKDDTEDISQSYNDNLGFNGNIIKEHIKDPLPPLFKAICEGSVKNVISHIKSHKNSVNGERFHSQPPLHYTCHLKKIEILQILLQFGAKVDEVDGHQNTALYVATVNAWPEGVKALLENGAPATQLSVQTDQTEKGNGSQNNLLHSLLQSQRKRHPEHLVLETTQLLINAGLNIDSQNLFGASILYCAALADYPRLVRMLLEMNANPVLTTKNNRSVLHAACQSGSHESLEILLQYKKLLPFVTLEDDQGNSPFHLAVKSNCYQCCLLLLENGDHLMNEDSKSHSRSELLDSMPSSNEVYTKLFDSSIRISGDDIHDPDLKIKFNYKYFTHNKHKVQCSPIFELMESEHDSVLEHPLIEHFLSYKWNCIKPLFYIKMFIYFIFLIVHSWYIIQTYGRFPRKWINSTTALICFQTTYLVLFLSFLIPDVLFMLINFKRYFKQWETINKLFTLSTAAFIIFSPRVLSNSHIPLLVQTDSAHNEVYYPLEFNPLRSDTVDTILGNRPNDDSTRIIFPDEFDTSDSNFGGIPVVFPASSNSDPIAITFPKSKRAPEIPVIKPQFKPDKIMVQSRFGIANIPEADFEDKGFDILNSTWSTYIPMETYTAAVSGFLSWIEFMMLMAKVPSLGIYILIYTHVAISLGKFLLAFSSIIIGFAITFHVIFKNIDAFGTVEGSIIKTMVMMIGEIDYGNLLETPTPLLSKIFLIIFLFFVTVLMANLLIGLTIEDIPKLKHRGRHMRLIKQASYLASYENLMTLTKKLKCFPIYCILVMFRCGKFDIPSTITVYPNRYKTSPKISREIINKVTSKWIKDNECGQSISDITSIGSNNEFKYFKEQYISDKRILHNKLDELLNAINNKKDQVQE